MGTKLDLSNCFDQHRLPKHYLKPFYQKQVERWFAGILDLQPCDASKLGRCVVCGVCAVLVLRAIADGCVRGCAAESTC